MPFKISKSHKSSTETPESLLLDLRQRQIPGLLAHQADILREYVNTSLENKDVAFQLPTGSGKTLVGLLLGEWRRLKFGERVIYLCPTNQLVNQVANQSQVKYGLKVRAFTGRKAEYESTAKSAYLNSETIAITSYSSLFNSAPFFDEPHIIILDDVHSAENYIAGNWSVRIDRHKNEHRAIYIALLSLLRENLDSVDWQKVAETPNNIWDDTWVDKIPTLVFYPLIPEIVSVLDEHTKNCNLRYQWRLIRDHLHACHLYLGTQEILIRPLIPPTNTHKPFANAKQRVYMSATLGEGGDLERITGRKNIVRLRVPSSWDKQGIGRRLFFFPSSSLDSDESEKLVLDMIRETSRALIITSNTRTERITKNLVRDRLKFPTFDARQIEESKQPFVSSQKAVAIVANRYDGIDFLEDECRLLIVKGLSKATNLQERFFINQMGAYSLLNDRILTRIVQAFGRCTRSATDYAAVVIWDESLHTYLMKKERRQFMHPELQAEIEFGIEQSKEMTGPEFLDNLKIFMEQNVDWSEADQDILSLREDREQVSLLGTCDLAKVVSSEIDYQYGMWQGDFVKALDSCRQILAELKAPELRGYRALWNYLAGSAAWLSHSENMGVQESIARRHFSEAMKATTAIRWLVNLSKEKEKEVNKSAQNLTLILIERLEVNLQKLGILHNQKYSSEEKFILENLQERDSKKFEAAHERLGGLLGFDAGKQETRGSPDPWWLVNKDLCLIFEDHSNAESDSILNITKARQASTHNNWVRDNLSISENAEIITILITPVSAAESEAFSHLKDVYVWKIDEFRNWAQQSLTVIRELRRTFSSVGNLEWREKAIQEYIENKMDPEGLVKFLKTKIASQILAPIQTT